MVWIRKGMDKEGTWKGILFRMGGEQVEKE